MALALAAWPWRDASAQQAAGAPVAPPVTTSPSSPASTAPVSSASAPQVAPPTLPPVPRGTSLESAGPTAASPARNTAPLPATARGATGDVPLGGEKLRAKIALPPLNWNNEKWARFSAIDWTVSAVFGAAGIAAAIIPPLKGDRRSGPVGFDKGVRNALKIDNVSGRFSARDSSDAVLSVLLTYPLFIDGITTAWWLRGNADVARQMVLIDLEAMAMTVGTQGITNTLVARERPYGVDCGGTVPAQSYDCSHSRRYRSFFSGHSSQAFTSAGLICYHHLKLGLLGSPLADGLTCAAGYAAAAATATLRVAGDMHYASDVLTGAAVGTLYGLGIPFLHYHGIPTLSVTRRSGSASVSFVPSGMGAAAVGTF